MLKTISRPLVRLAERWLPSALTFAVVLTLVVALLALLLTDSGPVAVTRAWGDGLIGLLAFMTQMALILLLGHTLAHTGPVRRLLTRAGTVPRTEAQAYGFVVLCAALASLITWGLGLVVGALLAIEVARSGKERGLRLHFPLLVAAGYSGFVVWHMGYSGSGPLAAATPGSFVEEQVGATIPVTETLFSWWNITGAAVTVVVIVLAMAALAPSRDERVVQLPDDAELGAPDTALLETGRDEGPSPAERLDGGRLVTTVLGLALLAYLVTYFAQEGFVLTLDIVNWTFLCLIMLLVGSPAELGGLVVDAARNVGDILLQFPLYAGILGIMTTTGLLTIFADFFVSVSTPATLGLWAFLSGGLINLFVPSGGGQFAVQAPIFLDAADTLGVDPSIVIMAVAYGDQWTNMLQPFWALPVLAIARLRIRDIMGFTAVTLLLTGVVFALTIMLPVWF
ncbi:short-chain fatty acid transporter [Nocardioides coralli]|uniref:short-chain fatty acid transporter n=1 Tax=Nocardioides coralli TaxID=2872154 RepID=UPI001CA3E090|nr:TIGR00366 family protein [Nocardioides coralli]QZY29077.1 TIGR00366 family protein [Nocardioides coralli]